jgi:hypothetical protein
MEENSKRHGRGLGTESSSWRRSLKRGKLFRRERVTGGFGDCCNQSDQYGKMV